MARLITYDYYEQCGINPKTKKPQREKSHKKLKDSIKHELRILDEQTAVERFKWFDIPCNLSSAEIERWLYFRGQLCFFYVPALQQFFFTDYALEGTIDFYGRPNTVHPIPMNTGGEDKELKGLAVAQQEILSQIKLDVLYGIPDDIEKWARKFAEGTACVIIQDYTPQKSVRCTPRADLMEPVLEVMAQCIPYMRTSLIANTGIKGMRIPQEADYPNVLEANEALQEAALEGDIYLPIIGSVEFQELLDKNAIEPEAFMMIMQSLDNYRLSLYGLDSGGLFQKASHMLQAEQNMNAGRAKSALQNCLSLRQYACDIINAISMLGISCELSEASIGVDKNFDGMIADDMDQSGLMEGEQDEQNTL